VAELLYRRRALVVALSAVVLAASWAAGASVVGLLNAGGDQFTDAASESRQANVEVERRTGVEADPGILLLVEGDAARVEEVRVEAGRDPAVARTVVDRNGVVLVYLRAGAGAREGAVERLERTFAGAGVLLGGGAVAARQVTQAIQDDLTRAELLAFPLLFLLSLWVFRGAVAALLPPLVGAAAIGLTFAGLRGLVEVTPLSVFALNLVTGLGFGLAIDYSLLVVSRWREEAAVLGYGPEALRRTLATAGRTVFFSSLTVAASMACLLVFPQQFLSSMGLGGVLVAVFAGAVALVPLPALLALLGPRIDALAPARWQRPPSGGRWARLARWVMRRPGRVAAVSAAVLLALALPAAGVTFTGVDTGSLPASASARQVSEALERLGVGGAYTPVTVIAPAAPPPGALADVARLAGVAAVVPPVRLAEGLWRLDVVPAARGLQPETQQLVRDVRALLPDARVTGQAAGFVDQRSSLAAHLPWALLLLCLTTFVLVFLATGSVLLPLKSLVVNALTLGAAFGVLVLVFEEWRGLDGLELTQPILLCATAFALSTDYAIFLFSRIREAVDRGLPNREAVADGLERTGRVVTAAALLFCVAIGTFATSSIPFIQQLGVGTATAVALDATIVRAFLVPSLMALLGVWNWWAPGPLRRLHARLPLGGV
jgi:RND superfamily putative drug exporter